MLVCVNLCLHWRWATGPSQLLRLPGASRGGWLEPWLALSLTKAVKRYLWIIYCNFMVVAAHVNVCCSQHYSPGSLCPLWTQDFASQSCVLISRYFFWWDPCSIDPGSTSDEAGDCQPESCRRRTVKWAWPNECAALWQATVGFSMCWNTEDTLFIFMCYVHYLCKIAHEALLRAFREVNFARTMTQSFSLLRNFNVCVFVYCVKLFFGNGRK